MCVDRRFPSAWPLATPLVLLTAWLLTAIPAAAQEEGPAKKSQVIQLKYANAADVAEVLKEAFGDKRLLGIAVDDHKNSVFVSGSPLDVASAAKLIQVIDVAGVPHQSLDFYVVRLRGVEPDKNLQEALRLLSPNPGMGRFVIDPGRKLLIVQGTPQYRKAVEMMVMQLEAEAAPHGADGKGLQVRVLWIVGGKFTKGESAVPAGAFGDIGEDLKLLGLNPMRVAAHTLVQVTPGTPFEVSGGAVLDGPCTVKVTGKVTSPHDGTVGLDVSAAVVLGGEGTTIPTRLCDLRTELRVPVGKLVMVGATPVHGEPTAFAIQVTEPGPGKLPPPKKAAAGPAEFRARPWAQVLEWLSDRTGLPVIAHHQPGGTFSAQVPAGLSEAELLDLLNDALMAQMALLVRGEKSIVLVAADERIEPSMVRQVGLGELPKRGRTELVSVVVTLKGLKVTDILPEVRKMLGPFGSASAIDQGNQLVLQDLVGNLRAVCKVLAEIDAAQR
jgi:hypothetical protein